MSVYYKKFLHLKFYRKFILALQLSHINCNFARDKIQAHDNKNQPEKEYEIKQLAYTAYITGPKNTRNHGADPDLIIHLSPSFVCRVLFHGRN